MVAQYAQWHPPSCCESQYIIVTIVIVVKAIVIVIAISIIIMKNIEAFLLRQSVHIKLPVRVTTGAHLKDKKLSIKIEMKGGEFSSLDMKDCSPGLFGCSHSGQRFL